MRAVLLVASLATFLGACARSEEASLLPPDDPAYNMVEQVRSPEGDDQEVAIGEWRPSLQEEVRVLEFGPVGAAPLFSFRCDERRGVLLQRHGALPVGDLPMMLVSVGNETRRFALTSIGGTVPLLRAAVPPSDPMMETLVTSAEPLVIRIGDTEPLVLPANPSIAEFVRSCASPEAGMRPGAEGSDGTETRAAPGNAAEPATPAPAEPVAQPPVAPPAPPAAR